MNFCPECGADLKSNPNAKYCYSCGNQLTISDNLNTNHIENVDLVKTDINPDDDFNYFDFPESKHFREFMLEVIEHVQSTPNLSNNDIAKKYFEKGEDFFEARTIYFKEFATLGNPEEAELCEADLNYQEYLNDNQDDFINNTFENAVNCYEASLHFAKSEEAYFQLFVCNQYGKDYKNAHKNLILYAETCKEFFGVSDNRTIEAATFCRTNYSINYHFDFDNLPDWMMDQSILPI
jgi:hypothetical protein